LGFVISLSADIFWDNRYTFKKDSKLPVGYIDRNMRYVAIEKYDPDNTDYNYLTLGAETNTFDKQHHVYANVSARLAKEIQQRLRITLSVFNFINARSNYYIPATQSYLSLRSPVSFTAGINLKF